MITLTKSLLKKVEDTIRQSEVQPVEVVNIREGEGLVVIRTDSVYASQVRSTLQFKLDVDGVEFLLCEGNADTILASM